jgi:hypothetical protein
LIGIGGLRLWRLRQPKRLQGLRQMLRLNWLIQNHLYMLAPCSNKLH